MRQAILLVCLALVPGCFTAVDIPAGPADASLVGPGPDASTPACTRDSDCPVPPSNQCTRLQAVCDQGVCSVRTVPPFWANDPGACQAVVDCDCQDLVKPPSPGVFECNAGRCTWNYEVPGCTSDLECRSGQICQEVNCGQPKTCVEGCRDSTGCLLGQVCELSLGRCGTPSGHCLSSPACSQDKDCPGGTVCDYLDGERSCVAGCHTQEQCGPDATCVYGACDPCETCACHGTCQATQVCKADAECAPGSVCATEFGACTPHCLPGCTSDEQCRPNQSCSRPKCAGCGCDHGDCVDKPAVCATSAECRPGQVCAFVDTMGCSGERQCTSGCLADADCGADQTCNPAYCGPCCPGACIPKISACSSNAECKAGQICNYDDPFSCSGPRHCVAGCLTDTDCPSGTCLTYDCGPCCAGKCADPGCQTDADCKAGTVCEPGPGCTSGRTCVPGCHLGSQCKSGEVCVTAPCLTCPCPGTCLPTTSCGGQPSCSTTLGCSWSQSFCDVTTACCTGCPLLVPPPCLPSQCLHRGGVGTDGCEQSPECGPCCDCPAIDQPVCGTNYQSYGNSCVAACAGVPVLHQGNCEPFEGLECAWNDPVCAAGQYCRDPCPMCASIQQLRCTKIGACAQAWDCPGGLPTPTCSTGPAKWACVNNACTASCP